jgi:hypothetical protein
MRFLTALCWLSFLAGVTAAEGPADAFVEVDCAKADRSISKEPKYVAEPRYALYILDPQAKLRVWAVLDKSQAELPYAAVIQILGVGPLPSHREGDGRSTEPRQPGIRPGHVLRGQRTLADPGEGPDRSHAARHGPRGQRNPNSDRIQEALLRDSLPRLGPSPRKRGPRQGHPSTGAEIHNGQNREAGRGHGGPQVDARASRCEAAPHPLRITVSQAKGSWTGAPSAI